MAKYIFITGGVMSGIGKGIATASIARILKSKGFKATTVKIDPYINMDAGTMNPVEHGEVFVLNDGLECDQDLGNYERFLEEDLTRANYMTTGRVYQTVLDKERNLEYGGRCVQVIRDIPDEVLRRLNELEEQTKSDFILTEIGGTVGDYENVLFLEAARKLKLQHKKDVVFILVSYLPIPHNIGEMKTKPTQHAVKWLNMAGIQPDIIIARGSEALDEPRKEKIAVFCNVEPKDVISAPDIKSIYEVPLNFEKDNLGNILLEKLDLEPREKDLKDWQAMVDKINNPDKEVKIGIVGKYFQSGKFTLMDSYISVLEAIKHASFYFKAKPKITWVSAESYEENEEKLKELSQFDGVIVPGGFGKRGVEGKIKAIQYLRENKIPFLGLCLGLQMAVIEFARNVCDIKLANSAEFCDTTKVGECQGVIDLMEEQKQLLKENKYGGTMRLGAYDCKLKKGSLAFKCYKKEMISERHRHRYEVNNDYKETLEKGGLVMSGLNPEKNLIEIIELPQEIHPFFIASQFHPEFKSRPLTPHPLFKEFVNTCLTLKEKAYNSLIV